jgi:hypothetical protein
MHTIKETDMLATKMDLLLKRLDERAKFKEHMNNYTQVVDSPSACEVCGNGGHSGNDCPEIREDVAFMNNNNGYRPQGGQGWNRRAHLIKEVITTTPVSIQSAIQTNPP